MVHGTFDESRLVVLRVGTGERVGFRDCDCVCVCVLHTIQWTTTTMGGWMDGCECAWFGPNRTERAGLVVASAPVVDATKPELRAQLRPGAKHTSLDGGGDGLSLVEQAQSGGKSTERGVVARMELRRVGCAADANDVRLILRARVHRSALGANADLRVGFTDAQFYVALSGVIAEDPVSLSDDVVHRVDAVVRGERDVAQRQPTLGTLVGGGFGARSPGEEKVLPHVDPVGEVGDGDGSERARERTRRSRLPTGGAADGVVFGDHGFAREFFRAALRRALAFTRANDDDGCATMTSSTR